MRGSLFILAFVAILNSSAARADDFTVATWNLQWFFDADTSDNQSKLARDQSARNNAEFQARGKRIAAGIATINPTVIALQEVENYKVARTLATRLSGEHGQKFNVGFVQGNDTYTEQDVAVLVRDGVKFSVERESFLPYRDRDNYKDLSKHAVVKLTVKHNGASESVTLVVVHLIADGAGKRQKQARTLRAWLARRITNRENLIVLGDFNAGALYDETKPKVELGLVRGLATPATDDDLIDLHKFLPANERATHRNGKQFDRIVVSPAIHDDNPAKRDLKFTGIKVRDDLATIREENGRTRRISDHNPVVATFRFE